MFCCLADIHKEAFDEIVTSDLVRNVSRGGYGQELTVDMTRSMQAYVTAERSSDSDTGGFFGPSCANECFVFLERVTSVPHVQLGGMSCARGSSTGGPYVRIWAEARKSDLGQLAEWPVRHCKSPTWFSAKPLGFALPSDENSAETILHVEVRDGERRLAYKSAPFSEVSLYRRNAWSLNADISGIAADDECTVSFIVLDADVCIGERKVFFIRHGESEWNKAQNELKVYDLLKRQDHPLSEAGRDQAFRLADKLQDEQEDQAAAQMLRNPDVVYVSPLTRAIQTAVIGLGSALTATEHGEMVLLANAREKMNFGGMDSRPEKTGADVIKRACDELATIHRGHPRREQIQDALSKLRFDTQDVVERWWPDGTDSIESLHIRLREFMAQLLYSRHKTVVVVGHSHFFRECFRKYLSDDFDGDKGLAKYVMPNCGVACVTLNPLKNSSRPIVDVRLLFGAQLDRKQRHACCPCSSSVPEADELLVSPHPPAVSER